MSKIDPEMRKAIQRMTEAGWITRVEEFGDDSRIDYTGQGRIAITCLSDAFGRLGLDKGVEPGNAELDKLSKDTSPQAI